MDKRNVDVVLVRMDKIGDLVVSLPVDEHPALAGQRVHWFITKGLGFVAEQSFPKRTVTEFKRRFSPGEFLRMVRWFKENRPRTVVLLHAPWWASMAAWLADIPERLGRASQWHSFLFLNVGVRQSRKVSDRHESDFNFELVEWGFNRLGVRRTSNLQAVKARFLKMLAPNPMGSLEVRGLKSRGYRIVHPGMAGSALNWPPGHFVEMITRLAKELPVVVTGTKADHKYLSGVMSVRDLPNVKWLVDELKPYELLDLLSEARAVIAPSTGVIHLAASLGTPVLGIYSPRRVEHPRRWGPRGVRTSILMPPAAETDMIRPEVMAQISVDQALEALRDLENGRTVHGLFTSPSA